MPDAIDSGKVNIIWAEAVLHAMLLLISRSTTLKRQNHENDNGGGGPIVFISTVCNVQILGEWHWTSLLVSPSVDIWILLNQNGYRY